MYVQRFNNCVGGGSQDIRDFLQDFANSAGFDHVNDYLNSQRADLSITQQLGFGVEHNIGGVSNGVSDLGTQSEEEEFAEGTGHIAILSINLLHYLLHPSHR